MRNLLVSGITVFALLGACDSHHVFDASAETSASGLVCADLDLLLASSNDIVRRQMLDQDKCAELRGSVTVNVVKTISAAGEGKVSRIMYQARDGQTRTVWIKDASIRGGGVRVPR